MRKPHGAKVYNQVHKKLSQQAIDTHKQELIDAIVKMINDNPDQYIVEVEGLVREALEIRSVKQLRQWLE